MKAKDLRERSVEDLKELEKSLAKDTFTNRFKNFTNRLDDTSLINKTKRDLARVKTIIAQLAKPEVKAEAAPKAAAKTSSKKKKASSKKSEAK